MATETNDERFHRRQRELKACRCADCRRSYVEAETLAKTRAWDIQYTPTGFRSIYAPQPPIDDQDVNFARQQEITRAVLGSFRDV
jgi:hypothetical protein